MEVMDSYQVWEAYDRYQEDLLTKAPKCSTCKATIQEDYYDIEGEILCDCCLDRKYKKKMIDLWGDV